MGALGSRVGGHTGPISWGGLQLGRGRKAGPRVGTRSVQARGFLDFLRRLPAKGRPFVPGALPAAPWDQATPCRVFLPRHGWDPCPTGSRVRGHPAQRGARMGSRRGSSADSLLLCHFLLFLYLRAYQDPKGSEERRGVGPCLGSGHFLGSMGSHWSWLVAMWPTLPCRASHSPWPPSTSSWARLTSLPSRVSAAASL